MTTDVKITYSDYKDLDSDRQYEVIGGRLILSPAPRPSHQQLVGQMFYFLTSYVKPRGLGRVLGAPCDIILSEQDVVQPDVFFIATQRLKIIGEEGIHGGPDLCVEELSPRTARRDREAKRKLYSLHGVREYWIVDPDATRIEVYRLQADPAKPYALYGAGDTLTSSLWPDFTLPIDSVFVA